MIPKILHLIWVGNDAQRPDALIQTWADHHADWDVRLWGNQDLIEQPWRCRSQLYQLGQLDCAGVAAVMRWEILLSEGGVVVAADSLCLRELDAALLDSAMFACWENELAEPGVVSASYVGCTPGHPLVARIVDDIAADADIASRTLSETVGSLKLTQTWKALRYADLSILPSHSFIPRHPQAPAYQGGGRVYACEMWGSTLGMLDALPSLDPAALLQALSEPVEGPRGATTGRAAGVKAARFSIVIPTYNRMELLGQALASALDQGGDDFEVLVIDDGSTDGTAQALSEVCDARLRVVRQANAGTARARNRGIAEARGEFIVWLDSDDVMLPGTLAAHRDRLAAADAQADVLYGDLLVMDVDSDEQGHWAYEDRQGCNPFPDLLQRNLYPNPGTAVRRSLYAQVGGYDASLPASEDYDFWLRAAAAGARFAHIGRDTCVYRRSSDSRSADLARSQRADAMLVAKALREQAWSTLFPHLDWTQPQAARAQALLMSAHQFMKLSAWREVAEAAAGLQLVAAALDSVAAESVAALLPAGDADDASPVTGAAAINPQDPRLQRVAEVMEQFRALSAQPAPRFALDWNDRWLCLDDNTSSTGFDKHYTFHPAWAARILAQTRPDKHIDISSSLQFVTQVSAFIPTEFYDVRPVDMGLKGLDCGRADLTRLPFDDSSVQSISCMHVIEHVGLGRYGDELDYDGDLKAVAELKRVVANGGQILFVVPMGGRARIQFNAHRIYTYAQVMDMFEGWELKEFALIPDQPGDGGLVVGATQDQADRQHYGCGCFWFVRSHAAVAGLSPQAEQTQKVDKAAKPQKLRKAPNLRAVA